MSSSTGGGEIPSADQSMSSVESTSTAPPASPPPLSSPSSESFSKTPGIAPQNPFEQTTTPAETNTTEILPEDSIAITMQNSSASALSPPVSPARNDAPQSPIHHKSPGAVIVDRSSAPSTPVLVETLPRLPQSAPAVSSSTGSPVFPSLQPPAIASEQRLRHDAAAPSFRPHQPLFDDDENTEPSSAANTADHTSGRDPKEDKSTSNSFARFVQYTKRRMQSREGEDEEDDFLDGAVICGYLQKLGRNGKWQTRWFETDGECLSYYKSKKRTKLLATLDLEKVGTIGVDDTDPKGCSFAIQVLGRLYHLRAESRASCKDWVISLNRVKEARMQQGNVKLVDPAFQQPVDLLDAGASDLVAPRIVVVANRERTRAVDESHEWDRLMVPETCSQDPADSAMGSSLPDNTKRRSTIGTVVLARWSKRKTSLSRLSAKLARWARSVRKYGCMHADSVQLDPNVHPPGHDDRLKTGRHQTSLSAPLQTTKEPPLVVNKPEPLRRECSEISEEGARYLS